MKREEAIQNIKRMIGFSNILDESIFTLFPELKESEDERIIEQIKFAVMQMPSDREDTKKECLTWLEKQKINTEGDFGRGYDCGYKACLNSHGAEFFEKQKEPTTEELYAEAGTTEKEYIANTMKMVRAMREKQKEQKSSINIDQLKSLMLQYLQEAANEKDDSAIEADTDKWARKILGYDFEQKPAEWSEEDEKIAYTILNLLCSQVTYVNGQGTTSGKQFPTYAKERDWFEKRFKSLRPQYNGDATMTEAYKMGKEAGEASHWKPSEEQMKALLNAEGLLRKYRHIAIASKLAELYEELKKLGVKEEPEYYQHFDPDC